MDDLTHRVRNMENVKSADLFIPKKIIIFFITGLEFAINESKKSPNSSS